jgi:hypothetical protein
LRVERTIYEHVPRKGSRHYYRLNEAGLRLPCGTGDLTWPLALSRAT